MRLFTADEMDRMGWHARHRLMVRRMRLVERLRAEHYALYPDAQQAMCSEPGCRTRTRALGMCDTHYRAERRRARAAA